MGKKNKKNKSSAPKENEVLSWDALSEEKNKLIGLITEQQSFVAELVEEELDNPELKNDLEFNKTLEGLNKTYLDLIQRTIDISKEHGNVVGEKEVEGVKIAEVEPEKGEVAMDDVDQLMKYQSIANKYSEVTFALNSITTGSMAQVVLSVTELKAKKEGVNSEEVKEIQDIKETIESFKGIMSAYGLDNVHELVPTPESIAKEYEKAAESTKEMIESELTDINSKAPVSKDENKGEDNGATTKSE